MNNEISVTGGARIGLMNATWPFATFKATNENISLNASILGSYSFSSEQIVKIEKIVHIPFLGWGIRIFHSIPSYPEKIIFWCMGNPQRLLDQLAEIGFIPKAKADEMPQRSFPVRWQAIVGIIILWNFLFILDQSTSGDSPATPGKFSFLAVFLLFIGSTTIWKVKFLQKFILKPGRKPNEIKHWLYLLAFISGILSLSFYFAI